MTLKSLNNKKIAILGLGSENCALLEFLEKNIEANITVCDARQKKHLCESCHCINKTSKISWQLEKGYDENLDQFDIIFRIAGYPFLTPQITKAKNAGVEISSPTKFFFDICPTKNIIGVTGTKGKGTTASLIYQILKDGKKHVYFGGNIGIPMFSFFDKIKKNDWVVLELSSFQLEDLHASPKIAVMTNFFQDHLAVADPNNPNYHKTMLTYWRAKTNVFTHQKKNDTLIANQSLKIKIDHIKPDSKIIYLNKSKLQTPLVGEHNKRNIIAAELVAKKAGVKKESIKKTVAKFKGLEHRLEFVTEKNAVRYYNDSFSTTPDTAIIAINTFNSNSVILIAGGSDKGSDFTNLAKTVKSRVKTIILLPGKGSDRLKQNFKKIKYSNIKIVKSMDSAVKEAKKLARPGNVILLSPACASFGIFKNYKERGKQFKSKVKSL